MRSRIIGTGSYVPERIITNDELGLRLDTSDQWIVERTGIRERRVAAEGEYTSDLAIAAARRALDSCGLKPEEIDLIIVATVTGDSPTPSTSALVQAALGASRAFAFDLGAACAGSVYAISVADQFIRAGTVRRALVIGAELLSRFVDWDDRSTCIIFADGAGAVVLESCEDERRGVLSAHLHTDGSLAGILGIPGLGSRNPAGEAMLREKLDKVHMNGREVFRVAVRTMVSAAREALDANGLGIEDVSLVLTHQANLRIINAVLERLGLPPDRCWLNVERYGNTSSASIPMSLDEACRAGRLKEGDTVLMLAVGAGVAWGSLLLRW